MTYYEAKRTPHTPLELAQGYHAALGDVPPEMVAVLMAHGVLECGRDIRAGLVMTSCYWDNLGNIKRGKYPDWCSIRLNEVLVREGKRTLVWFSPEGEEIGGVAGHKGAIRTGTESAVPPGHPQTQMCAFTDLPAGIAGKLAFLRQTRFARALAAARRGDPRAYVAEIHAQMYFTADPIPYANGVASLFATYLPIARKERETPLALVPSAEEHIDLCISQCSRFDRTTAAHVAAVQLFLPDTIDWTKR